MNDNFNTYIEDIDADFWRELCINEGKLIEFNRGDEFATRGKAARYIGYIESGTLKYVVPADDGEEHVIGLEFKGEFVADFPFSLYGQKSRASIVAETPSEIYCFEVSRLKKMMDSDLQLQQRIMKATEAIFATVYDRYAALYTLTPQQRYDDLIRRHPDLFSLFNLKDIASFLNITPTHLSRIRKKK